MKIKIGVTHEYAVEIDGDLTLEQAEGFICEHIAPSHNATKTTLRLLKINNIRIETISQEAYSW